MQAAAEADLVMITGGLGPTEDDLTRQALAHAANVPLELHAPSLERIAAFFAARGRPMHERNRVQAMMPRGAAVLDNPCGTAPGFVLRLDGAQVCVLPGVPFEMQRMFDESVAPRLRGAQAGDVILTRTLRCCGPGEGDLAARLADLMRRGRNPEVGTVAEAGLISVHVYAAADSEEHAGALLSMTEREIRGRLGTAVFGVDDDTLASVVGRALRDRGLTLCTAESCTGGLVAKLVTDVAGSSAWFVGGTVSYSNELKSRLLGVDAALLAEHGAVSAPVACAMARGALRAHGADVAVAVTGIAGPAGGTPEKPVGLVYTALADGRDAVPQRFLFGSDAPRHVIRTRAALAALNGLRLRLLEASR